MQQAALSPDCGWWQSINEVHEKLWRYLKDRLLGMWKGEEETGKGKDLRVARKREREQCGEGDTGVNEVPPCKSLPVPHCRTVPGLVASTVQLGLNFVYSIGERL